MTDHTIPVPDPEHTHISDWIGGYTIIEGEPHVYIRDPEDKRFGAFITAGELRFLAELVDQNQPTHQLSGDSEHLVRGAEFI